jgi:hypothetical protein
MGNSIRTIIPAQPGWDLMEPCEGGMKPNQIVAWEIVTQTLPENQDDWFRQRDRVVYPIIVDAYLTPPDIYVIRRPDGVFVQPGNEAPFESDAEVLGYFQEELKLSQTTAGCHPAVKSKAPRKGPRLLRVVPRRPEQPTKSDE